MRIAIVCDDMIQRGGQERLVMGILQGLSSDHQIEFFTPLISPEWSTRIRKLSIPIHTSFLQHIPFSVKLSKFFALIGGQLIGLYSFNFAKFDMVLSVSARFGHHIKTTASQKHVCYLNSPGRMFWEANEYFERLGSFPSVLKALLSPILHLYRLADFYAAQRVDLFIANSQYIQTKIQKYYRQTSEYLHPYSDLGDELVSQVKQELLDGGVANREDFYLVITRLNAWKRVDIAVEAVGELGGELHVIGEGPDMKRLEKLAQKYPQAKFKFLGYVSEEEKISELLRCKAFIITQKEDFGITALEAKKCHTPVIAYGRGGVREIFSINNEKARFFGVQSVGVLKDNLHY